MKVCAMWLAKQTGLCMGRHARNVGWCLLIASSLVWFGCTQLAPRHPDQASTSRKPPPEPEPPLEILSPPRPFPGPPKENIDTQAPTTAILGQLAGITTEQDLDDASVEEPKLLPPVTDLRQLPGPEKKPGEFNPGLPGKR
jgi:hypothetical protein